MLVAEQLTLIGTVLESASPGYDEARTIWNGAVDRRPAVIAQCLTADDVAVAVRFARANDLEISVRGGGHAAAGHAVVDDGLVQTPRTGIRGSRVAFVHPRSSGGVLTEIVQPAEGH